MKKPTRLKLENGINLYAASMGKIFRVTHICRSDKEANAIMEKNPDIGAISGDGTGLILLAQLYGSVCPSAIMDDCKETVEV